MLTVSRNRPTLAHSATTGLFARVVRVLEARRSRKALGKLDDRLLRDIGIDRIIADHETRRFL
ncbi:DUF1127 domain-containing protein [Thioclava sp. BHET1]|nr:DUF1127 domain-containing protein [Thioclava sp. BHET1]